MFRIPLFALSCILLVWCATTPTSASDLPTESPVHAAILSHAQSDSFALLSLRELCTEVGPRLAGTEGMRRAHDWARRWLQRAGVDSIWAEPVTVPRWERGRESAYLIEPYEMPLNLLGLGRSVGTGGRPLIAEVLAVRDWDELEARAEEAAGRIVVFSPPWSGYGPNVQYRMHAANRAAAHGAVAALIRPAGFGQNTPRTGVTRYDPDARNIPTASITEEDAALLLRLDRHAIRPKIELTMEAHNLQDGPCANIIGELRGRENAEQIVLISAHLDAWDTGQGAHDDGAGCAIMLGAVNVLKELKIRPRRTIRVVLFTSEEYGGQGGQAYAERHAGAIQRHVLALESDSGAFAPMGFSVRVAADIEDNTIGVLGSLATPLAAVGADSVFAGWAGVDIGPLVERGVIGVGHRVHGSEYFRYHHGASDVFEAVDPDELAANVAAVAGFAYSVAEFAEFDGNRLTGPLVPLLKSN
jgi:carboxypeptidase Q